MRRDLPRSSMLERGVQVLQAFRPHGETMTLELLVRRTGLPKATVHRLAGELVELGLLERQRVGYRPGLALFELGELVPAKSDLREAALPFMEDLFEATHETVHLAVQDGFDVVYAEKIRGHAGVDVPSRVGGRLPITSTAVGKALLAYAEPEVVDAVLAQPLRRLTEHSSKDPTELRKELTEIRRTGLAYDREEARIGVGCIAAPVLVRGEAVAALSLTLPAGRLRTAGLAPTVHAISLALGRYLATRAPRPASRPPSGQDVSNDPRNRSAAPGF